jgi:hypothetical protein
MQNKILFGVDLDGPSFEFFENLCKRYGRPVAFKYHVEDCYPPEIVPLAHKTISDPNTYKYLNSVPGAVNTLNRLIKESKKYRKELIIEYITVRPLGSEKISMKALLKNGFPFHENITVLGQKGSKSKYLRDKKFTAFVDDSFNTCFSLSGIVQHIYLFDRIWNAMQFETDLFKRVLGWNDLYEEFCKDILRG